MLAGRPWTDTTIVSLSLCGKIATVPPACDTGRDVRRLLQLEDERADERLALAWTSGLDVAAPAAPIATAEAAPMPAATVIARREKRIGIRLNFMCFWLP